MKFDHSQRMKIRELFFTRVEDSARRTKIIQLASILADTDEDGQRTEQPSIQLSTELDTSEEGMNDDFWAAVYHYSLRENWDELEADLKQFKMSL